MREARVAASLNHPNICTIHEVGEADGQGYIAMKSVEGRALSAHWPRGRPRGSAAVRLQLAEALGTPTTVACYIVT